MTSPTLPSASAAFVAVCAIAALPAPPPAPEVHKRTDKSHRLRRPIAAEVRIGEASSDGVLPSFASAPSLPPLASHPPTPDARPQASRGRGRASHPPEPTSLRELMALVGAMPTGTASPFRDPLARRSLAASSPGEASTLTTTRPPSLVREPAPVPLVPAIYGSGRNDYGCVQHMLGCMRRRHRPRYCRVEAEWEDRARVNDETEVPYTLRASLCDVARMCLHPPGTRLRVRIDPRTLRHDVALAHVPGRPGVSELQRLRSCADQVYTRRRTRPLDLPAVVATVRLGRVPSAMTGE